MVIHWICEYGLFTACHIHREKAKKRTEPRDVEICRMLERCVCAFKSTHKMEMYKEAIVTKPNTLEIVLEQKERILKGKVLSVRYSRVWKYKHKWNTYSFGKRLWAGVRTEKQDLGKCSPYIQPLECLEARASWLIIWASNRICYYSHKLGLAHMQNMSGGLWRLAFS